MPDRVRADLSNGHLKALILALLIGVVCIFFLHQLFGGDMAEPGSPVLQSAAIAGSILLLAPFWFSARKRAGGITKPNRLFIVHVVSSLVGTLLIAVHAFSSFSGPPLVMLVLLLLLVGTGLFARTRGAIQMATTLGTKATAFGSPDTDVQQRLRELIAEKKTLLIKLDPAADEAVFSVTLRHWLRSPRLSSAYARLAREETTLIGARQSVSSAQAWWRPLHLGAAWVFLGALVVHVVVVTFFAGYAADGREITWWHFAAWGARW